MSLSINLQNLTTRVATECKSIRAALQSTSGSLNSLQTTTKTNLVAAINELQTALGSVSSGGAAISDSSTSTLTTWSSHRIENAIADAKSELVGGAGAALDTLNELAAAIANDPNFASSMATAMGKRVRVDALQSFSEVEKAQARDNIDAVSATAIGDTTTNFVTVFENGLV